MTQPQSSDANDKKDKQETMTPSRVRGRPKPTTPSGTVKSWQSPAGETTPANRRREPNSN